MTNKLQSLLSGQWINNNTPQDNTPTPTQAQAQQDNQKTFMSGGSDTSTQSIHTASAMNASTPQASSLMQSIQQTPQINNNQESTHTIRNQRTSNVKYMIYIFILILAVIVFSPYIQAQYDGFSRAQETIRNLENTIQINITRQQTIQDLLTLKQTTEQNISDIVDCINLDVACGQLNDIVMQDLDVIKDYLQLQNLNSEKMPINERKILRNINEFLLQKNPFEAGLNYNAQLNSLRIGERERFQWQISYVPLELDITFENKDGLMSFINNVERKLYAIKEEWTVSTDYALLYKIQSINYDVVNYNQTQDVLIEMNLYFYDA